MCPKADGWIFIKPSHNFKCHLSRTFEIMIPDYIDINSPLTEEQISVEREGLTETADREGVSSVGDSRSLSCRLSKSYRFH